MSTFEQTAIGLANGATIVARFFAPQGAARGAVLLAPAIGVPQSYYAPFAGWLAEQGYLVASFDYRGIGLSRQQPLRELDADLCSWGELDCAAMIEALAERAGDLPLYWIGHSLGGQMLPFAANHGRISKMVTIATGSGYWRDNAIGLRRYVWLMWYLAVPLALPLCGYFPGKALRMVGDLPGGVMRQWRRWCLHPDYAVGAEGAAVRARYAAVRLPIVSLSFSDDEYMSARNTDKLHACYRNAPLTMKRLTPQQLGTRRIGHFGCFKPALAQALWQAHVLPELAPRDEAGSAVQASPIQ